MEDKSCKTPRWRLFKAQLNNRSPVDFFESFSDIKDQAILIDVRTPTEYAKGHLSDSININYLAPDFWDRMEALPQDKSYFVYCRSGRRSIRTCTLMKNGGFDNSRIFNMDGGILQWIDEGRPIEY